MERRKRYPVIDGMKLCSKCNTTKTVSEFRKSKNSKGESSYRGHCKQCQISYYEKRRRAEGVKPNKWYPVIDGSKQCTICNKVKPVDQFGKHSRNISGLRANCKECTLEKSLQWRRAKGMVPNTFVAHPIIDGIKKCHVCLEDLPVDNFYVNKKGYMKHSCKKCNLALQRPYREKYYKRDSEELTDEYLRMVLNANSVKYGRPQIHKKDIPQEVFDVLRNKLNLQRELRQLKSLNQ
jgi:hypothetical protein